MNKINYSAVSGAHAPKSSILVSPLPTRRSLTDTTSDRRVGGGAGLRDYDNTSNLIVLDLRFRFVL